jgi:predicted  nucleic acid-binding Zn-ribbon protein
VSSPRWKGHSVANETQKLAALQDIDLLIRERKSEEDLGFTTEGLEDLEGARTKLASQLDSRTLRHYERLAKRYDRAVVPVVEHRCVGCSLVVPTAKRKSGEDRRSGKVVTCESCGRILFFV